jgi:hypothetical protein
MPAFEFQTTTKAKLASVNIRSEKHGAELVPAVDLKLTMDASNDILAKFDTALKESLYAAIPKDESEQQDLDGVDPVSDLKKLKFPKLAMPIKWEHSGAGYELHIDYGLGGDSNLVLDKCDVNNFAMDCKEGGTVELSMRIQVSKVPEEILGKLAGLVQHDIHIILTAPKLEDVQESIQSMESPFLNQADLDADKGDGNGAWPFPNARTPEEALAGSVAGGTE